MEESAGRGDAVVHFDEFFVFLARASRCLPLLHALGSTQGSPAYGLPLLSEQPFGELAALV
jgi:hypothetical protein